MTTEWNAVFRDRLRSFEAAQPSRPGQVAVAIKFRVAAGCFHREHSPHAYELIDSNLQHLHNEAVFDLQEHESGPEILVYLAVGTAGISLAKSVVDLVTTVIKARAEGIKKGDRPSAPLEVIVRRDDGHGFTEEVALRIPHEMVLESGMIEEQLRESLARLIARPDEDRITE